MGSAQSYIVASLFVCSVYLGYVHIYCSYKSLKTNILNEDNLPSFLYLYIKYWTKARTRRTFDVCATGEAAVYTVLKCRLDTHVLRSFCRAAGYGWDYPDAEFRDIPLCFPEFLCGRLLLMVLTDTRFRLSPAGLVRVRQSLKTLEPVDELRKGPFTLQVRVLEYRHVDTGVEVDISLTATSHTGRPVWESILTLLSKHGLHQDSRYSPKTGNDNNHESGQPDEPLPEAVKQVAVSVPLSPTLQSLWSCSDCFPRRLLSLTQRLFGYGSHVIPGLWTLSVCLAEMEKHKGVEVIAAPVSVTARFEEPLLETGKVMIKFWEMDKSGDQSSSRGVEFLMERDGGRNAVVGRVLKSSL